MIKNASWNESKLAWHMDGLILNSLGEEVKERETFLRIILGCLAGQRRNSGVYEHNSIVIYTNIMMYI